MSVSDDEWEAFSTVTQPTRRTGIAAPLGRGTGAAYLAVRNVAEPMLADRVLEPDIRAVRKIIGDGTLLTTVNQALPTALTGVPALARATVR